MRGCPRTDCQHHAANRLRPRRQVINESHQLRRQNHSGAVFVPTKTHRSQMLYTSLCRFLIAAKAVASGRAVVGGRRCRGPLALSSMGSAGILLRFVRVWRQRASWLTHRLPPSISSNARSTNAKARPATLDSAGSSDNDSIRRMSRQASCNDVNACCLKLATVSESLPNWPPGWPPFSECAVSPVFGGSCSSPGRVIFSQRAKTHRSTSQRKTMAFSLRTYSATPVDRSGNSIAAQP